MFRQRTWEYLFLSVEELCEIYFDWFRKLGIKLCKATKFLNGFLYHNESSVWYNTVLQFLRKLFEDRYFPANITCSKSTIETLGKSVKYVQS